MAVKYRIRMRSRVQVDGDPPIERIGRHMIEVWRAAEEIRDPELSKSLLPVVLKIGRLIACDLMRSVNSTPKSH